LNSKQQLEHSRKMQSSLSLNVPINPASSMYGLNNGMEKMDSISSFLPRPHNISSPSMNGKSIVQGGAVGGGAVPTLSPNAFININPMYDGADKHTAKEKAKSVTAAVSNGYKILQKQGAAGLGPTALT
jgi:hypothetical protein